MLLRVLRHALASGRYIVLIAVIGTFLGAIMLMVYETLVVFNAMIDVLRDGSVSSKSAKVLAVGLIEAIDIFLIAIVAYIISLGLYVLFVDDTLPRPRWLTFNDLDDLKDNLLSVIVAVLAVLFLREAIARDSDRALLELSVALALMIGVLTFFLTKKSKPAK
jgi:uncharacterized membrane protein YqhA